MYKGNSQLVCEYLENISRKILEDHQDVIRSFVRRRNGIYAMYRRGKLYYVGLASSLLGRLKSHLRDRHGSDSWDRFSVYLTVGPQHMKEIESLLLRIANPPGNRVRGKFVKCENMLRKVKAEYRQQMDKKRNEIFGQGKTSRKKPPKGTKKPPAPGVGRSPVLLPQVDRVKKLQAKVKGKTVRAWVRRDGMIRFNGELFTSPSVAGARACGRRTCNGWKFWKYERALGYWAVLDELRK